MATAILTYFICGALFFAYLCWDEWRSFVGEHKPWLAVGLCASLVWPLFIAILVGDWVSTVIQETKRRRKC